MKFSTLIVLLFLSNIALAGEFRQYVIGNSEIRELHSELTGKDYELLIGLPRGYKQKPEKVYPVIYLLDGQWHFPLVNSMYGNLQFDKVAPEYILVGITYGGENPDYITLRGDDYMPSVNAKLDPTVGGNAEKFLNFLESKIIPFVEKEYRVDPAKRVLSGSSYGGVFSLYTMFEKPDLFSAYISITPSVHWDNRIMFKKESAFFKEHKSLNKPLYIAYGSDEDAITISSVKEFIALMESRQYKGLELKSEAYKGQRHGGVIMAAQAQSIRWVFKDLMSKDKLNN